MSAYLHYGMISSFQLAKESMGYGDGGVKYRDELLIWRELSHHWCSKVALPQHWMSIPQWARETLQSHETDPREEVYHWHTLRWAQTKDELWNLCQHSLNVHGELHNNLRMTWGKQIIQWTSPRKALLITLDLNNRFALDGRDPSSYGGILWCFGLFDRPFSPENKVWGTIRPRTTESHVNRLDINKYKQMVTTSPYANLSFQTNALPFVVCLLQQALTAYNCTIKTVSPITQLNLPKQFSTTHQSKLLIGAWVEAGWLQKRDEVYTWTTSGHAHFKHLWGTIQSSDTITESNDTFILYQDKKHILKATCAIDQYQEAMHFVSTVLRNSKVNTTQTQMHLWTT